MERSARRRELIWDGKYDADGNRVGPLRVVLPFQTVETVNESAQERQRNLLLEQPGSTEPTEWRNRLIWGDKKYTLPSLLAEFAGKVNLIYYDPPFDTGADFSFTASVPDQPGADADEAVSFTKLPSIIEQKAYRDTWGGASTHLDAYLKWFYETIVLSHELLHETGTIYVHLDWRLSHYAKVILDEIFGPENFMCQIIWKRSSIRKATSNKWLSVDDIILVATKGGDNHTWNQIYLPYSDDYKKRFNQKDDHGDYYWIDIGTYSQERLEKLKAQGRVRMPVTPGAHPRIKHYLHEGKGVQPDNIWSDIVQINSQAIEDTGYPTQKPEALLERIVKASSNPGDLVMDAFAGSGTTAAVAERLGRRWITSDLGRFAIHTTRKRLLAVPDVHPFVVQNLGKYERQLWAGVEFGEGSGPAAQHRAYVEFILRLYQAKPIRGYTWLHGLHAGRMVHVGAVDGPVTPNDVTQIAVEFRKAVGSGNDAPKRNGVDVLGWDFAFELNEVSKQQAAAANIQMRFLRIPRDVMDKRAVEQGDVKFFELAALAVQTGINGQEVTLRLTDFVIPPDDVPEDVRKSVKHWSQWIDYWAVDWDYKRDTFHNQWQTYRTRTNADLELETMHTYASAGDHSVVVKVIDILGNDTTKTVKVKVK
jgi:adenine-specific DNA-methyltransferase